MKLIASSDGVKELTLDGSKPIRRGADGTFEVSDHVGRGMLKGSEFGRVGTTFRATHIPGYRCQDCGHLGLFRDRCKCGSSNLEAE
jgi:hypothetical protein